MNRLICCLAVVVALVVPASADIVTNGQFLGSAGGFTTVNAGSNTIPGWTVTVGSVDWIGNYWSAPVGQSVDMDGNSPGAISQDITTVTGQTYWLSFWLAGNPDGHGNPVPAVNPKKLTVSAVNLNDSSLLSTQDYLHQWDLTWTLESFHFTATGSQTTLAFTSGDSGGPYGPVVADIRVPGPDFYTEFALGLSGLGLLMFFRRKRQA
jgi:choice-of-anchor C domain-containing protein